MQETLNRIAIKVKPKAEKTIRSGHPWIYDKSIVKQSKEGKAGDLAIIFDQNKNKFLACGLYDPNSPIRIKVLQFKESVPIDEAWFESIIRKAAEHRETFDESQTNAYRLIYGENDGLPGMIVDKYDDTLVLKFYSEIWFPYREMIYKILLFVSNCKNLVIRFSRNITEAAEELGMRDGQFVFGEADEEVDFIEQGIQFRTNVVKGHKTGFFLDHRQNRIAVGELAENKNVLDVFSYAGGFSVHALVGGAKSATCIDISEKALEVAQTNAVLNGVEEKLETLAGDAFRVLKELRELNRSYELIVVDPPSFAKSKQEKERALVQYRRLINLTLPLLEKEGILVMASCSSRIHKEDFFELMQDTLTESGRKFNCIKRTFHDVDHPIKIPEAAYLKCGYYKVD